MFQAFSPEEPECVALGGTPQRKAPFTCFLGCTSCHLPKASWAHRWAFAGACDTGSWVCDTRLVADWFSRVLGEGTGLGEGGIFTLGVGSTNIRPGCNKKGKNHEGSLPPACSAISCFSSATLLQLCLGVHRPRSETATNCKEKQAPLSLTRECQLFCPGDKKVTKTQIYNEGKKHMECKGVTECAKNDSAFLICSHNADSSSYWYNWVTYQIFCHYF